MVSARLHLLLAVLLLALASAAMAQETGWGMHKRMFAVPTPGKVKIDGKLDDWDLSGALTVYVVAATRDVQSGRVAVMYDADALYLGAVVRDPSPMMNRHSPEAEGDFAWDADSFQFRLVLDAKQGYPATNVTWDKEKRHNDQLVHLLLWYYTDRKEANLQVVSGMDGTLVPGAEKFGVVPKGNFQAAYKLDEDGKGYTLEYRIPWASLGAKTPPRAGDVVASTLQFNWGRADGLKTAGYSAWGYDLMAYPGFPYQNAGCWGKLILSKTGHLPRELVDEGMPPEKPLPLTFAYDLPEESQATVALINDKHEVVRTLMAAQPRLGGHLTERWDGLDNLGQPLPAGTYTWKGLYHKPITTQYVLSVHNSGQPSWKNDTNTGGWGGDHGSPIAICTVPDGLVLAWNYAEAGWGIIRTDAEGRKRWGALHNANQLATDNARIFAAEGSEVRCYDLKDCRPLPFTTGAFLAPPAGGDDTANLVTGLAYHDGTVYVSYAARESVGVFDAKTGALRTTWAVPAPGALAMRADGDVLAVSAGTVVALHDGKATPLLGDHLDTPSGLAVDAAGAIYVSNRGKLQNVAVFSADGKYQHAIGKAGGRPALGKFDSAGILDPAGIVVDAKNRLWVMECIDSPKRVSVWDAQTGTLDKEFFGGAHYSSFIWMDPEHPDEVYCDGTLWKIDLDKKSSYPYSTLWRGQNPNAPGDLSTHGGGLHLFTAKNGKQYGWAFDNKHSSVLFIRDGDVMKPLLADFYGHAKLNWPTDAIPYPTTEGKFRDPDTLKKHPWDSTFAWVDANGDGIMQPEEIVADMTDYGRGFASVDRELNLWHATGHVFRPIRIEADGRPVYDFSKPEKTTIPGTPEIVDPADGGVYTLDCPKPPGISFGKYNQDGTLQWGYAGAKNWPDALSLPPQQPGKLWGPTVLLGTAGDFTGFATYFGVHHLYTRDGLCVGTAFRDPRLGSNLGPDIIACENYNGQLVKPKGMERYFALGGDQDGRITEIFGLDTVKRLPGGTYTITDADAKKVIDAQTDYQAKLARGQRLTVVRSRTALDMAPPVSKTVNAGQAFQARAAYDEKNLYVMFDVTSPSPLVNGMTDPQLLFKGGNCLDIQLAADPTANAKRDTPALGDQRLLVSRQAGKPIAVLYTPKVKDFKGQPVVFRTGNVESFDSIAVVDQIALNYQQATNGAFRAVVTVPLALLGWTPQPGTKVKMDLGYIFGNNEGTKAMVRSYWSNNGFSANVLNDVPNESKLTPKEWGMAEVE